MMTHLVILVAYLLSARYQTYRRKLHNAAKFIIGASAPPEYRNEPRGGHLGSLCSHHHTTSKLGQLGGLGDLAKNKDDSDMNSEWQTQALSPKNTKWRNRENTRTGS
ncbi:hypothetical protein B0H13DRAFT_2008043 [Mycena leptocephala]|nr:hypothetical protein B0H13DRAFT_2008043 [Mycena leptocephala]